MSRLSRGLGIAPLVSGAHGKVRYTRAKQQVQDVWSAQMPPVSEPRESQTVFVAVNSIQEGAAEMVADLCAEVKWLSAELAEMDFPYSVQIGTLSPEPYKINRPISVVIREHEDCVSAEFIEAGIGTSGDTTEEAISNLKELIAMTYESLRDETVPLASCAQEQLAILQDFITDAKKE